MFNLCKQKREQSKSDPRRGSTDIRVAQKIKMLLPHYRVEKYNKKFGSKT
jgi:hypothetical protein